MMISMPVADSCLAIREDAEVEAKELGEALSRGYNLLCPKSTCKE